MCHRRYQRLGQTAADKLKSVTIHLLQMKLSLPVFTTTIAGLGGNSVKSNPKSNQHKENKIEREIKQSSKKNQQCCKLWIGGDHLEGGTGGMKKSGGSQDLLSAGNEVETLYRQLSHHPPILEHPK